MLAIQSMSNTTDEKFSQQIKKNKKIIELKRNIVAIQKKKEKNHFAWEHDLITDDFYKTRIIDLKTEDVYKRQLCKHSDHIGIAG